MQAEIRKIIAEYAHLTVDMQSLDDDADLYRAGLTSHASINLMLALEDEYDVEFPQTMLKKGTFASVNAIAAAISELLAKNAPVAVETESDPAAVGS